MTLRSRGTSGNQPVEKFTFLLIVMDLHHLYTHSSLLGTGPSTVETGLMSMKVPPFRPL